MQRAVRLFIITKDRAPAGPPKPAETFSVNAPTTDGLRDAVRAAVSERGRVIRSVSFGPKGLVAYAEEST
ncbi:MAG: hypothetical protein KC766_35875 [Myxococcales bacterium]|nr:hypothetical protein [Myxococcales bacterium]